MEGTCTQALGGSRDSVPIVEDIEGILAKLMNSSF
jgi:hypothetical protein